MGNPKVTHAKVRRTLLKGKKVPDAVVILNTTCSTASSCAEVQGSPLAVAALATLKTATATATASSGAYVEAQQLTRAAGKTVAADFRAARKALATFEGVVDNLADGNAKVIADSGLLSRDDNAPTPALARVTSVVSKLGTKSATAKVTWPAAAGASSYAVEVNLTPANPAGTWTSTGEASTRRSRVVTAPAPGGQILARVMAVASDGTSAEWSDVILVTTR